MKIKLFQVDAFTNRVFGGNPAAVCVLDEWLPDAMLQKIAFENNLSETAFFTPCTNDKEHDFHLRWFTPAVEVDLCGHATLATSYCLFEELGFNKTAIRFKSRSGLLTVTKNTNGYTLDFPKADYIESYDIDEVQSILGLKVQKLLIGAKTFAVLDDTFAVVDESPESIKNYVPDIGKIKTLKNTLGLVITARGTGDTDFVSRLFAPQIGIDEDPVTGAIHCTLTPYWSSILGKTKMNARQLSAREGDLAVELSGQRVLITGNAVLYLKGEIEI